jgi:hypothetical protein
LVNSYRLYVHNTKDKLNFYDASPIIRSQEDEACVISTYKRENI